MIEALEIDLYTRPLPIKRARCAPCYALGDSITPEQEEFKKDFKEGLQSTLPMLLVPIVAGLLFWAMFGLAGKPQRAV